jgi:hypothetical protein
MKKIAFLSGAITNNPDYIGDFARAKIKYGEHMTIISPAFLPIGLQHEQYMRICKAMIDECDMIIFLDGWEESRGSNEEYAYGLEKQKFMWFDWED